MGKQKGAGVGLGKLLLYKIKIPGFITQIIFED